MKIMEELEEQRKAVASIDVQNLIDDSDPIEEEVQEEEKAVEEPSQEEVSTKEEPAKEEKKEEASEPEEKKDVVEEKPDSSAYARMRRENAALKKKLQAQEASPPKEVEPEARQEEASRILVDVIKTVQEQKAEREFSSLEGAFSQSVADYNDVSHQYKTAIYQALRVQNPRESHANLLEQTKKTLLTKASQFLNEGLDPIQELYEEAKSLGFKAIPKEETKQEKTEKVKPDLDKIAVNRSRNSGMVGAKGSSGNSHLTRSAAVELTAAEWSKLPIAERKRLLGGH